MAFETADAAIAALQNQEFVSAERLLPEADRDGLSLDAAMLEGAMLADAGPSAATEATVEAIMLELGEAFAASAQQPGVESLLAVRVEPGEAHGTTLLEIAPAPSETLVLDEAETGPSALDYDLVLAEPDTAVEEEVLPGDIVGDPLVSQSTGTIVVTGNRVTHYFYPSVPPPEPPVPGSVAVLEPADLEPHPDAGYHVFEFRALGLKFRMPEAEYNALNAVQKSALFNVFDNYHKSADLTAALQHLKNEEVQVVIRFGTQSWNARTGLSFDFGRDTIAGTTTDYLNGPRTDLRPGSPVFISFNSNHSKSYDYDEFSITLIHELLHPWVPNILQADNSYVDDERAIDNMAIAAWGQISSPQIPTGS
ncbi:MAG TPA: hypothetical protein VGB79_06300 [Allosphingosinicella sp.]|jgi:hypothetical protein